MAFLIELLISKVLSLFIYKLIGWNEKGFDELIHNKTEFVYYSYNKFFVFVKYLLFILLFCMVFFYVFVYFYSLYNGKQFIPSFHDGHINYDEKYQDKMIYNGWVFLLFSVAIYLNILEEYTYLVKSRKNTTAIERKNLRCSFRAPYWIVLICGSLLRIILIIFLEDGDTLMNISYLHQNILLHPDSASLTIGLCVSYYLICITSSLIIIFSFTLFFSHRHIKLEYLSHYVKNKSLAEKIIIRYSRKQNIQVKKIN